MEKITSVWQNIEYGEEVYDKQSEGKVVDQSTPTAEYAGTIVDHGEAGRAALHPQPSKDPNDPLVNLSSCVELGLLS